MQKLRNSIDVVRFNQWLVALDVHHNVAIGQAQQGGRFSQSVAATEVISSGHDSGHTILLANLNYFGAVSGHHHLASL